MKTEYDYKFVKNKYLPIIDVLLKSEKSILLTEAYIDSGATISAFNYKVAKILGVDYKKGKEVLSKGITERTKAFKVTFDNKSKKVLLEN